MKSPIGIRQFSSDANVLAFPLGGIGTGAVPGTIFCGIFGMTSVQMGSWMISGMKPPQNPGFPSGIVFEHLPSEVLDAISANIVPFRSATRFWLEDGYFYGYEGCFDDSSCCEGTCTHVWSYAHTAASLFPRLERSMRLIEFCTETDEEGYISFRTYKRSAKSLSGGSASCAGVGQGNGGAGSGRGVPNRFHLIWAESW
jgi:hypothetical protein